MPSNPPTQEDLALEQKIREQVQVICEIQNGINKKDEKIKELEDKVVLLALFTDKINSNISFVWIKGNLAFFTRNHTENLAAQITNAMQV